MSDAAILLVITRAREDAQRGREIVIPAALRTTTTIGRAVGADIVIADKTVSRSHCAITWEGSAWTVANVSSSNGLFVNDTALLPGTQATVAAIDKLQVGGVVMRPSDFESTDNVLARLSTATTQAVSVDGPLFVFDVDASTCAVSCRGRLMTLAPLPSLAFWVLCQQPGKVVHQWDILDVVGEGTDLARVMSELRSGVSRVLDEERVLPIELERRVTAVHGDEALKSGDRKELLRRFVHARRGHGYLVCMAPTDVEIRDNR